MRWHYQFILYELHDKNMKIAMYIKIRMSPLITDVELSIHRNDYLPFNLHSFHLV